MTEPAYPTETEIHAFIDDELSLSRREEIERVLCGDPALAMRVAAYQSDRDRLRSAFDDIDAQPVPSALAARIEGAMAARRGVAMTRRIAVAAGLALAASAVIIARWQSKRSDSILAEAKEARDGRLDGRIAGGDPLPPPASRDALLRSTLGLHVRAPDLQRFGFQLMRMDLFRRSHGGAAQLQYSDTNERMLTMFIRRSDGTVQFDIRKEGAEHVCIWQDDVVGTVIIAQVSAAEMLRIASSAYTDLNL